ncbi:MAG: VWA domain-containing protein [Polyangiaceae bacterium]|nr:VWA domain-containing protein [Polyangiaceae bacterium]
MSIANDERCIEVEESIADVLEGNVSASLLEHIAGCDRCRDLKYEAEQAAEAIECSGADFQPTEGFAERMLGLVLEARPEGPQPSLARESSLSTSSIVPRTNAEAPTSGAQRKSQTDEPAAAETMGLQRTIASAPTEFAPRDGVPVDTNATIIQPAPTMIGEPSDRDGSKSSEAPTVHKTLSEPSSVFVPTHKTVPLSAVLREPVTTPQNVMLTPMPPVDGRIVEATTGRNNTGPQGILSGSSTAGAQSVESTLRSEDDGQRAALAREAASRVAPGAKPAQRVANKNGSGGAVVSLFRRKGFIAALVGGMAAAAAVGGFLVKNKKGTDQPVASAEGAWTGNVLSVSRASADGGTGGFEVCNDKDKCAPAVAGAEIGPGSTLKTDAKTRARVKLSDETWLAIDRNSEVALPAGSTRQAKVVRGLVVADVAKVDGAQPAKIQVPQGEIDVIGTKVAVTVTDRRAAVEVVRGEVDVTSASGVKAKVRAGEEATLGDLGEPVVAARTTMSDVLEWSSESQDDVDAPALRGVGELRAKKPGQKDERVGAVRLTKHSVKVRVVDVVARTEVDETFTNTTDEELEGIFRFPLPPGAQIENLALEVDGKLLDGAFVDRDRGAAIWRGVIQNAAPKAPKPKEEIFWVPGPWRDPALLEWQRGGRFELRIFPIPKKGSRRVVLTYTQTVPQAAGVRRFTYPLAHDSSGSTKIDEFNVDAQVLGHDASFGIESRGYQLARAGVASGGERFTLNEKNFVPAGDLTLEYALPSRTSALTAWAYDMPAGGTTSSATPAVATNAPSALTGNAPPGDRSKLALAEAKALAEDGSPFVAFAVRPTLPRFPEGKERLHVIVVDSSRSMVGERFARATHLASSVVREMDRRDEFIVLACDTTCQAMGASEGRTIPLPTEPSAEAAQQVESFLGSIEPDGGSNLLAAVQAARTAAGALSGRELRIIYLGDGTPTVGPTKAASVEAGVRHVLPSGEGSVIAVALGADADTTSLGALARGGNGVLVPYVPGQRVNAAAVDVLASAYGSVLSDVEVVLPPGLTEITPKRLDPIPAGGEAFIFARMPEGKTIEGSVVLRGRVGNERFEQTYTTKVAPTSAAGNAFVPRMFAAAKIDELQQAGLADDRDRVVALSKQFSVASQHTSLIVLESEAMFKAFGLEKNGKNSAFTGEEIATSESSSDDAEREEGLAEDRAAKDEDQSSFNRDAAKEKKGSGRAAGEATAGGGGVGFDSNAGPMPTSKPAATASAAPMTPPARPGQASSRPSDDPFSPSWGKSPPPPPVARRPAMIPMRKVFDRKAQFSSDKLLATEVATSLVEAETALKAAPDSRDKTVALYKALMASGRVGEALELASKWSQRDALDPDALLARADLAAMNGDRERAIRILSGLSDVRPGDKAIQKRLATVFTQMGLTDVACHHRIALADIDSTDTSSVASAVRCSQDQGLGNLAQTLLSSAPTKERDKIETTARTLKLNDIPALFGDVRVTATWNVPVDLDLAVVDKNGKRLSWLGSTLSNVSVRAKDATSTSTETLSLSGMSSGNFMVEVVRAKSAASNVPVTGELVFTLPGGETRRVPFTLTNQRLDAGSLRVFFTSRLVPVTGVGGWGAVQ